MGNVFSNTETKLRENKRRLNRAIRDLDRQRLLCEREEQSLISRIKVEARQGRTKNVRTLARDIVRNRKMVSHYCTMKSQLMAVQSQLQSAHSTNLLASNLKSVGKLVAQVSGKTNVVEFQKIMQELGHHSEALNLKMDIMEETLDDSLADAESLEEEDRIVGEILEELGIKTDDALRSVAIPTSKPTLETASACVASSDGIDLQQRIDNLRR